MLRDARRRTVVLLSVLAAFACAPSEAQVEPPRLLDRIFSAGDSTENAISYLTKEDRRRHARRFDRYRLQVRRLSDGALIASTALGDTTNFYPDSTPRAIGIANNVFWLKNDSLVGYRLPSLTPVSLAARATPGNGNDVPLRDTLAKLSKLPFWEKPGLARLFTSVSDGLLPVDSVPVGAARALPNVGVLMRDNRLAWYVGDSASVLVFSSEPDSTWSLSRVTREGEIRWTTPTSFKFSTGFVLLDASSYIVFMDTAPNEGRSGARDRVLWVHVLTGAAKVLEIGTGGVSVVTPR